MTGSLKAQLRTYQILPSATDPRIDIYTSPGDEHYVYLNDSIKPLNKLFVFLPGTLGRGKNPRFITPFAASVGYHAINLTYCSDVALAQFCKNNSNIECFENGRQELIYGDDLTTELNVNQLNSIENRLKKLLLYLSDRFPNDNWKQFLTSNNEISWEKICIGGQSQGGGHAAYIAQKTKVGRVLMFASPKDYSNYFHAPGNWLKKETKTPINRYFGFVHSLDETNGCTWAEQKEIFSLMGLDKFGKWINVDNSHPPYEHTRTLTSTNSFSFPHGAPINDLSYKPVWRYLLLEHVD